jgi:23S rRNA (pseudouridine1915-N3)-methyltransferase
VQISLFAIGRMKAGPERELVARYEDRFAKAGASLGLAYAGTTERAESAARDAAQRKREEAALLDAHCDQTPGTTLILLDETGKALPSEAFAALLARHRDNGTRRMVLAIGGADGHDPALKLRADAVIAFGPATWPHQIVRVMLAEQLYRAATILSGHPYHRA